MAGSSITFTETRVGSVKRIKAAWVSDDTTGAVSGESTYAYNGKVELLTTVPDGTAVPTASYDVAANDADGLDVLAGGGANRSATATEQVLASSLGVVVNSTITVAITNAGNSKEGTVYIDIR